MHTDLPEAQKVLLFLEDWKWEHDPVCLLRRNQCLAILLHPWRDLEITEETGGFNFLAGKGMDVATQGLQNATTELSDAVTAAENAVMKTEDENAVNANEQEGHSSTSPSSRIPAPDLKKNLPNTQPQPANPKSEDENAVMRTEHEDANKRNENSSTPPPSRMPAPDQAALEKDLQSMQPHPANPRSEEPADYEEPAVIRWFFRSGVGRLVPVVTSLFSGERQFRNKK